MTVVALALCVALLAVVVGAAAIVGRALRAGERRERQLLDILRARDLEHAETLDRVMYASGKPWKDTADRDEPDPDFELETADRIVLDPVPGAMYGIDEIEELDRQFDRPGDLFDTRSLEATL